MGNNLAKDALAAFAVPARTLEPASIVPLARTIALAMMADGKVVPEEEAMARVAAARLPGLSALADDELACALSEAQAAIDDPADTMRWIAAQLDAPRRHLAYCVAAAVVIADRVLDAREQVFLRQLARALDIDAAGADELLAGVGRILQIQASIEGEPADPRALAQEAAAALEREDWAAATRAFRDAIALTDEDATLLPLLEGLGRALAASAEWMPFLDVQRRRMTLAAKVHGEQSLEVATVLVELARGLEQTGEWELPARLYRTALAIRKAKLGIDHTDVADVTLALGWAFKQLGRFDDALPLLQVACAIRMRVLGDDHSDVGDALDRLADLLDAKGDRDQGMAARQRSLEIKEKQLAALGGTAATPDEAHDLLAGELAKAERGKIPSKIAEAARMYGLWLVQQGRPGEAVPHLARAVALVEQELGDENPNLATRLEELALCQEQAGSWAAAGETLTRVVELREKQLGEDDAALAPLVQRLGQALFVVGESAEAVPHLERALKLGGEENPMILFGASMLLGGVRTELGDYEEAEAVVGKLIVAMESPIDLEILRVPSLRRCGKLDEAAALIERWSASAESAKGIVLGTMQATRAVLLRRLGRAGDANGALGRAREAWSAPSEAPDPSALVFHEQAAKTLRIREALLGEEHPLVAWSLLSVAEQAAGLGRPADAEPLLARVIAIREGGGLPSPSLELAEALEARAIVCWQLGRDDDAEKLLARALAIPFKPRRRPTEAELGGFGELLKRGNEALRRGDLPVADESLGRARELGDQLGVPDARRAFVANQLARVRLGQRRLGEAETLFHAAISIGERAHGKRSSEIGPYVLNLALAIDGDHRAAERELVYERAGALMEGGDEVERGLAMRAWSSLGIVRLKLGKPDAAKEAFAKAIAVEDNLEAPDPIIAATTHEHLGGQLAREQDFAGALAELDRMQRLRERAPSSYTSAFAQGAVLLLGLQLGLERPAEADATLDRILALLEKEPAMNANAGHIHLAAVTIFVPSRFLRAGAEVAEALVARVTPLLDAGEDERHLVCTAMLYRAALLIALDRAEEARPLVAEAWGATDETVRMGMSVCEAATTGFLRSAGDEAGVRWRALIAGAYHLAGREPGGERDPNLVMADAFHQAGALWADIGRHAEAKQSFTKALASREAALGPDHAQVAADCQSLAAELVALEEWPAAAELLRRALSIREKIDDSDQAVLRKALAVAEEKSRLSRN